MKNLYEEIWNDPNKIFRTVKLWESEMKGGWVLNGVGC